MISEDQNHRTKLHPSLTLILTTFFVTEQAKLALLALFFSLCLSIFSLPPLSPFFCPAVLVSFLGSFFWDGSGLCVYAGVYAHVVCESASQRTRLDVMSLTAIPLFSSVSPWIGTYHSRLGGLVSPGIFGFVLPPQLTSSLAYLLTWRLVEEGSSVSLTSLFPFPIFVFPHFPFPLLLVPFSSISLRPPRTPPPHSS